MTEQEQVGQTTEEVQEQDLSREIYIGKGANVEQEEAWVNRVVTPHWHRVGYDNQEVVYVNDKGQLIWPNSPQYIAPSGEAAEQLSTSEVTTVELTEEDLANAPSLPEPEQQSEQLESVTEPTMETAVTDEEPQ